MTATSNMTARLVDVSVKSALSILEKSPNVFAYRALGLDPEMNFHKRQAMNRLAETPEVKAYLTLMDSVDDLNSLIEG